MYKEWGYDLFPKLAFENLVERTETLCRKAAVGLIFWMKMTRMLLLILRDFVYVDTWFD